jgi:hypothetical protein
MNKKTLRSIYIYSALVLGIVFVVKFGAPSLLKFYVQSGIGDCRNIPILCMNPVTCSADLQTGDNLPDSIPYISDSLTASVPKGFAVVEEILSKPFYKKHKRMDKGNIVYLLRKDKGFFVALFPQVKAGNDYEFIKSVMYAKITDIKNITDTFFVIMKGVFIPDLGDQNNVKMCSLELEGMKGFINYNLGKRENLFDCNFIGRDGSFYKVYIKDRERKLDLAKVSELIVSLRAKN